jgi:rRNA maturation protein Nop10
MQDYLFVSFFLGHGRGEETRALLRELALLEEARDLGFDTKASVESRSLGPYLRLPVEDARLQPLLDRLRDMGVKPFTRLDREHTAVELDSAEWLVLRTATAGLWGGVDYGQEYDFSSACPTCGAGARVIPPLLAEIGAMGKKGIDHLVYEGHLIVTQRVVEALDGLTGFEALPVRSKRRPPDARFAWLKIANVLPRMDPSTTGYAIDDLCPTCGRAGHYGSARAPEAPIYARIPADVCDFNQTFEFYGNWRHSRVPTHVQPVGGGPGIVVSQRARQALLQLRVRRLVWVPVATLAKTSDAVPPNKGIEQNATR